VHGNARLTPVGRLTLVMRIETGRPVAHVAAEMGISRPTAYKWWRRWRDDGEAGLYDRSSRPRSCPHRTRPELEAQIAELRLTLKQGPVRIGWQLGVPASTVHRVLCRLGLNRLAWIDRPTGEPIRRYQFDEPGGLVHVDIKKLGRIPDGGGWRAVGKTQGNKNTTKGRIGYDLIHTAIDDCSRLAYSEILRDERKETCAAFWLRANAFFNSHGITVERVLTDNGPGYRSNAWRDALGDITPKRTRPYRPQTNGKVERFNRTLIEEWAYVRVYSSNAERTAALDDWLHLYNHHRRHTALKGLTPIARVNDLPGHYS
jgi:transposase InsO family protein